MKPTEIKRDSVLSADELSAMKRCIGLTNVHKPGADVERKFYRVYKNGLVVTLPDRTWEGLYRRGFADHDGIRMNEAAGKAFALFSLTRCGTAALSRALGVYVCFKPAG